MLKWYMCECAFRLQADNLGMTVIRLVAEVKYRTYTADFKAEPVTYSPYDSTRSQHDLRYDVVRKKVRKNTFWCAFDAAHHVP